jgi:hypothetical protein
MRSYLLYFNSHSVLLKIVSCATLGTRAVGCGRLQYTNCAILFTIFSLSLIICLHVRCSCTPKTEDHSSVQNVGTYLPKFMALYST